MLEIFQKLSSTDETMRVLLKDANRIMMLLLIVLKHGSALVREKAMLAVGALACAIRPEFINHMPLFNDYLKMGLEDWNGYAIRLVSVMVAGDICRFLDYKVLPFCEEIMAPLLKELCSDEDLHPYVKPLIFSCIGDMALAIAVHFEDYVRFVLPMMKEAVEGCAESDGEYKNGLKRIIFEAYSGSITLVRSFNFTRANFQETIRNLRLIVKDEVKKRVRVDIRNPF